MRGRNGTKGRGLGERVAKGSGTKRNGMTGAKGRKWKEKEDEGKFNKVKWDAAKGEE